MPLWFIAAASASSLQVGVKGADDAKAIHLFFGDKGEVSSSCVPTSKGWTCKAVDVDRPSMLGVVVDTTLVPAGNVEESGSDLTLNYDQGAFDTEWNRVIPPTDGLAPGLLLVQVQNADPTQAPMLRAELGSIKVQMGCADDGSFPDPTPNDGVFYCAQIIPVAILRSESWMANFSIRDSTGEDVSLGVLTYPGGNGVRFAGVTIGDSTLATNDPFALAVRPWEPEVEAKVVTDEDAPDFPEEEEFFDRPEPELDQNFSEPPRSQPPPQPAPKPPDGPEVVVPPEPVSQWVWLVLLFCAGGYVGHKLGRPNKKSIAGLDAARVRSVDPLLGGGPTPEGAPIQVLATEPADTGRSIIRDLTALRRVVVLGSLELEGLRPGHEILEVTDPDKHAVIRMIRNLCTDGGVPPVLIIMGSASVLDTGGASATPTQDLMESVSDLCWAVRIETEAFAPQEEFAVWGHDAQAGWSFR